MSQAVNLLKMEIRGLFWVIESPSRQTARRHQGGNNPKDSPKQCWIREWSVNWEYGLTYVVEGTGGRLWPYREDPRCTSTGPSLRRKSSLIIQLDSTGKYRRVVNHQHIDFTQASYWSLWPRRPTLNLEYRASTAPEPQPHSNIVLICMLPLNVSPNT